MADVNRPRLSVIGTGYLGATHAVCMTELGYQVIGLDTDVRKITQLSAGETPFFEPGLDELLRKNLETGRLQFTTSYEEVAEYADIHFICVGTPQRRNDLSADLTYVESAFSMLATHLKRRALVVGKSTVPVGTAARMAQLVVAKAPAGAQVEVAWNPEFLREGFAVEDTLQPDRLVFGVRSEWAEEQLRAGFEPIIQGGCPVVVTDYETSELVKGAANSFLATKISFINAMAEVCEVTGADIVHLSKALGYDSRIGHRFLQSGLGFGGGCLPKDIRSFMSRAAELGVDHVVSLLQSVDDINISRRRRTVAMVHELLGDDIRHRAITVLGAAFKPNSDDIRDSPSLDVAATLSREGARVTVYDPAASDNAQRAYPELTYAGSAIEAARESDIVLVLTEWTEFGKINPKLLAGVVGQRKVIDARNTLDPDWWRGAGWTYRALGRPA